MASVQVNRMWSLLTNALALSATRLLSFASRAFSIIRQPSQLADLYVELFELLPFFGASVVPGPSYVSPMASMAKRQSGRLAQILLDYSKQVEPQQSIDPGPTPFSRTRSVVVIDLDNTIHSVQADHHGFVFMLLFTVIFLLSLTCSAVGNFGSFWLLGLFLAAITCLFVLFVDDHTLTLVGHSGTPIIPSASARECTLLLEDDIVVVLNGAPNLIEAILEGRVNHSLATVEIKSWQSFREGMCNGVRNLIGVFFVSQLLYPPLIYPGYLAVFFEQCFRSSDHSRIFGHLAAILLSYFTIDFLGRSMPVVGTLVVFIIATVPSHFLFCGGNYPIQPRKLLAMLGYPLIEKWDFHNEAAAVTFLSLVLSRGFPRPIRGIDISGVMELLVPDQRDVWRAWRDRVGDRIVHEVVISFAPTIPMFGDQRQEMLKQLLDDAQLAYDMFMRFYHPLPQMSPSGDLILLM